MVHAADLVVGMTSILLVEAAALGRPVLSIVPIIGQREWLGELSKDIICVSNPEGILAHLSLGGSSQGWPTITIPQQNENAAAAIVDILKAAVG